MTRKEIKLKSKEDIRGKVFACFVPFLIIYGVQALIGAITGEDTYGAINIIINIMEFPLSIGLSRIFLNVVSNKDCNLNIGDLFEPYKNFKRIAQYLISYVVSVFYIILGLICFIVPGIILALRYSMLQFILADYPDITWRDALAKCKEITDNRKDEIFDYYLSFIGWFLLSICTFGILFIYVLPYMQATFANLYYQYNPKASIVSDDNISQANI